MDAKKADREEARTVEINIALPSLTAIRTRLKTRKKIPRKALVAVCISGVVAIAVYGGYYFATGRPQSVTGTTQTSTPATKLQQGTPNYQTILPANKTIEDLGGWTRVSPPHSNPVFAYVDHIDGTPINVSQQPLPDEFKSEAAQQVEQLALGYKANEKITVGSVSVHIGTSAKGPQSVIFNKDNLLVLIKSGARIDNSKWVTYINSLQ